MAGLQCENNLFYFAKCLTIFGKEYQGYNMKATNPLSFFMFPSRSKDFEFRHEHFSQMPHSPCQLESILENAKSHSISQTLLKANVFFNSIWFQYTDELTPHVEWLEDKKTLANR